MSLTTPRICLATAAIAVLGTFAARGAEPHPSGIGDPRVVSPGATRTISLSSTSCPTFLWSGVRGGSAYELRVYRGARGAQLVVEQDPVIEAQVPGGATGWTPPGAACLEPGVYSWLVRARRPDGDSADPDPGSRTLGVHDLGSHALGSHALGRNGGVWTEWSEAAWFEVPERPSDDDVARALEILERRLAGDAGPNPTGVPSRSGLRPPSLRQAAPGDTSPSEIREPAAGGAGVAMRVTGSAVLDTVEIGGELTVSGAATLGTSGATATFDEALLYNVLSQFVTVTDTLEVDDLIYTGGDRVEPGGGAGYFSVGSATYLDVDSNTHTCANGGLVRGLRLIEQPTNQLAFELICTN